jgi:hypothetical protein
MRGSTLQVPWEYVFHGKKKRERNMEMVLGVEWLIHFGTYTTNLEEQVIKFY